MHVSRSFSPLPLLSFPAFFFPTLLLDFLFLTYSTFLAFFSLSMSLHLMSLYSYALSASLLFLGLLHCESRAIVPAWTSVVCPSDRCPLTRGLSETAIRIQVKFYGKIPIYHIFSQFSKFSVFIFFYDFSFRFH